MIKTYKLYTNENTIFYIGKTKNSIQQRLKQHIQTAATTDQTPKYVAMRRFLENEIEIKVAKLPTDNEDFEIIKAIRAGHQLTNIKKGDQSPHILRLLEQVSDKTIVSLKDFEKDCQQRKKAASKLTLDDQLIKAELRLIKLTAEANKLEHDNHQTKVYIKNYADLKVKIDIKQQEFRAIGIKLFDLKNEITEKEKIAKSFSINSLKKEVKALNKDIGDRREMIDAMNEDVNRWNKKLNDLIADYETINGALNK